jgi:hypothetical protein
MDYIPYAPYILDFHGIDQFFDMAGYSHLLFVPTSAQKEQRRIPGKIFYPNGDKCTISNTTEYALEAELKGLYMVDGMYEKKVSRKTKMIGKKYDELLEKIYRRM